MNIYSDRRKKLVEQTEAPVLLVAAFEELRYRFLQDSTFYYYTGCNEPGAACIIYPDGTATLYIPNYATNRAQWVPGSLLVDEKTAERISFETMKYLGQPSKGYTLESYFDPALYKNLLEDLTKLSQQYATIYTPIKNYTIDSLCKVIPTLAQQIRNVMPFVARMRRSKSKEEIQLLHNAIDVTMLAQEAAARAIKPDVNECQVAAAVQYVFVESGALQAFPSIIGSGSNATVLHYNDNCRYMQKNESVIVDVGACLDHYCGDITRTYPVSGTFSPRNKEVYTAVLETQQFLAEVVAPGYWLRNDEVQEKSLYHLMHSFLRERKLDQYIAHGVGHFLGMDVHDVGDIREPLQEGDVITIEPGVYIPKEQLGVRIEDNYWIVQGGVVCLSAMLPKTVEAVQELVRESF
jgi:Xaa-Pro aminopeptidase